ncbi:hypothetical protein DFA_04236 [Cavenderia fasciculata]|uniref:Xanthine/uracil/vitamin C permease n=1 Tax=Cavenderia fasciculata TaxID=261658 RepID=F4PVA2_CACFS|nr:uncharacterized protein DFA_04236 [Cavenderia fasciculata]EGG20465.1 hypothetical protein DFA_04236 [Cavenderia fasciculata]|eukprot:XP_004358236.1 hypothetical protein DFA_04236 [Cavenderia fasciculata]
MSKKNYMTSSQQISLLDSPKKPWSHTLKDQMVPTSGDVNALFSVLLDNLANIASMVSILVAFGMPMDFVARYFVPGPAIAVMLGSLSLSFYSIWLDHKSNDPSVLYTSIPIGLDAPTTIGLPLLVVGPAFLRSLGAGNSTHDASMDAWLAGCTTVFLIGVFKVLLSLLSFAQGYFHPVGKAGALAGIGLALLGLNQLLTILEEPVAGWISLWVLFLLLLHRVNKTNGLPINIQLPFNLSGVLLSAVIGSLIYYVMAAAKISVIPMPTDILSNYVVSYPHPADIFSRFASTIQQNISIAIPYAILVNIGGLTICDAAVTVGNNYNTRVVLLIDSATTIIGSFLGAVTQTTPYIGHTVFHQKFKARSGYSVITGVIIGLGGFLGYISFLTSILPKPAIIPIFIFIAFEICSETFHGTLSGIFRHHAPAIVWSFFPALFQFVNIILSQISPTLSDSVIDPQKVITSLGLAPNVVSMVSVIIVLAHGFILTSLLWGTSLGYILDNQLAKSAIFLAITAFVTFFGVIHSVNPNGEVYLPWNSGSNLPYHWSAAYLLLAIITYAFSFYQPDQSKINLNDLENNLNNNNSSSDNNDGSTLDIQNHFQEKKF